MGDAELIFIFIRRTHYPNRSQRDPDLHHMLRALFDGHAAFWPARQRVIIAASG
jgi:hypothetical protein